MSNDDHRMMTALFGPGVEEHTQDSLRLIVVPGVRLPRLHAGKCLRDLRCIECWRVRKPLVL
jgi:hypothetical protein